MYKGLVKKYVKYFNEGNLEEVSKLFHKDSQLIRLMTNDVLYDGKEQMSKMNERYMKELNVRMKVHNLLEFNNIVIMFSEIIGMNAERIAIIEIKDNLICRVWASQFNKEEE